MTIPKRHLGASFGTPGANYPIDYDFGTLLVCCYRTNGCMRSTLANAFAYLKVALVEECLRDDGALAYADVIWLDAAITYLDGARSPAAAVADR